jgi:hypothetical protein
MQDQLFRLPLELSVRVLSSWLSLREVVILDTAECNHASRAAYIEALRCEGSVLHITQYGSNMTRLMQWVIDRKARAEQFEIGFRERPRADLTAKFFDCIGPTLLDLSIAGKRDYLYQICNQAIKLCPHLQVLSFWNCSEKDASVVRALITQRAATLRKLVFMESNITSPLPDDCEMTALRQLVLKNTLYIKGSAVCAFLRHCPNLQHIYSTELDDTEDCLHTLAQSCPSLTALHYGYRYEDSGVYSDHTALGAVLLACKELHTLNFLTREVITHGHVAAVAEHGQKLKSLRIVLGVEGLQDADCISILAPRLSRLEHLGLDSLENPTEDSLRLLAQHCQRLVGLDLSGFQEPGGSPALASLITALPGLQELDLSFVHCLDDNTLAAMGESCARLQRLRICFTQGFTVEGITALVQGCAALRVVLFVRGNAVFNKSARTVWQAMRPGLRFDDRDNYLTQWNDVRHFHQ